jgi:hypothetical protein
MSQPTFISVCPFIVNFTVRGRTEVSNIDVKEIKQYIKIPLYANFTKIQTNIYKCTSHICAKPSKVITVLA